MIIKQTDNQFHSDTEVAPTSYRHLGLFIAKHLKYFQMEIEFTPLEILMKGS